MDAWGIPRTYAGLTQLREILAGIEELEGGAWRASLSIIAPWAGTGGTSFTTSTLAAMTMRRRHGGLGGARTRSTAL